MAHSPTDLVSRLRQYETGDAALIQLLGGAADMLEEVRGLLEQCLDSEDPVWDDSILSAAVESAICELTPAVEVPPNG